MENKEGNKGCGMGSCSGCGCGHHHMRIMRSLIKVALAVIIFSFAFKMGELKGMLESRGYEGGYYRGGGMMLYGNDRVFNQGTRVAPASPSLPVTPPTVR